MSIGENLIMNMWRLNVASISIEKLLDDILKEVKNDNLDKIQFSFNDKCENLRYNMSYLCTIVHPLIIIRLLEHRLFTPLLKKTNSRAPTSVSLSIGNPSTLNQQTPVIQPQVTTTSTNSIKLPSSTSFPSNTQLSTQTPEQLNKDKESTKSSSPFRPSVASTSNYHRKCSEGINPCLNTEYTNTRKPSQVSLFNKEPTDFINENITLIKPGLSPSHNSSSNYSNHSPNSSSKTAYLKDLSKRLLKRVNSSNQFSYSNFKKSFKNVSNSKSRKNSSINNQTNEIEFSVTPSHRNSLCSLNTNNNINNGQVITELSSVVESNPSQVRHSRSNTNSIDRNSHIRENMSTLDNLSLTGSPMDIKEFEKKLINLPTFTISDENATNCLLPSAISATSLLDNNNTTNSRLNLVSTKALTTSTEIVKSTPNEDLKPLATTSMQTTTSVTILKHNTSSIPFIITKAPSKCDLDSSFDTNRRLSDLPDMQTIEQHLPRSKKRNSLSLSYLYNSKDEFLRIKNKSELDTDRIGQKQARSLSAIPGLQSTECQNENLFQKASKAIKKSFENLFSNNSEQTRFTRELRASLRKAINKKRKSSVSIEPKENTNKSEYLKAPKSRRVRSNSPSYFKSIIKSKSNYDSMPVSDKNGSSLTSSNPSSHKSYNHLLTINRAQDKEMMKSSESTNSTFSAGFLPSPDMHTPSAPSSIIGFDSPGYNRSIKKTYPFSTVALATATISSSLVMSKEQQEKLKNQFKEQLVNLESKSGILSKLTQRKITASTSLTPIKITVQNESGSPIKSSPSQIESDLQISSQERDRNLSLISSLSDGEKNKIAINPTDALNNNSSKPGSEVLSLISIWIKNSPNDFMGKTK